MSVGPTDQSAKVKVGIYVAAKNEGDVIQDTSLDHGLWKQEFGRSGVDWASWNARALTKAPSLVSSAAWKSTLTGTAGGSG